MTRKGGFFRKLYHSHQMCWIGLVVLLIGSSLAVAAPQPTATVTDLNKDVYISFQGETPVSALAGTLMRQGDAIRAYSGADAMLHLSDGSKVRLEENSNLRIIGMTKEPMVTSSFELLWGRLHAVLSPLYQKTDSSFTVQTPNAVVTTTSSELDAEVLYEPTTKTTTVLAHEFDVDVINVITGVSLHLTQGHSAIIYEGIIQEIAGIVDVSQTPSAQQQPATITSLEGEVFVSFQGAVSTSAIKGTVLRAGDEIYTDANASAVMEFSDGTKLKLGEDTNITIFKLSQNSQGTWIARLKLLRGSLRTILGDGFKTAPSSCIIQTSNVQVGIQPADEMDAEIMYDPNASITTLMAHKSDMAITHLLTEISATIPQNHSGIIYNHVIQQIERILRPAAKEQQPKPQANTGQPVPASETGTTPQP